MMTALLFIVPYLVLHAFCNSKAFRPLKHFFEKDLTASLVADVKGIDEEVRTIVSKPVCSELRVPEDYFSVDMLSLLIRYLESGQAIFIKEAVYALKLELENTGYYSNNTRQQNLLQKEKEYLANETQNLAMLVETGGK
jgi:hypothetical protein